MSLNHGEKTRVGGIWMSLIFFVFFSYVILQMAGGSIWLWPIAFMFVIGWAGYLAHKIDKE